jgi:membrane protein implicated in regulation of membrane protease activity
MKPYQNISIAIFLAIMVCLAAMAITGYFWLIVILGALIPVLVAIQVWAVLRGKEKKAPERREGEEDWYEND